MWEEAICEWTGWCVPIFGIQQCVQLARVAESAQHHDERKGGQRREEDRGVEEEDEEEEKVRRMRVLRGPYFGANRGAL